MSDEQTKTFARTETLANGLVFDADKYEFKDDFVPGDVNNPMDVHTVAEMVECLKRNPNIELEAKVLVTDGERRGLVRMDREKFLERAAVPDSTKFREALDSFANDDSLYGASSGAIGQDFTPLVGGPFFKQLYQRDYLRMHSASFYAYHHDPIARAITNLISDFTLGRGFRVDSKNERALLLWNAFAKVNDIPKLMEQVSNELTIYGEIMLYWLPKSNAAIRFGVPEDRVPKAIIPRVRLIDPSNIVEVITHPEDIQDVIAYQWLAPTQYQTFTAGQVPTAKFIFQQLPAELIDHVKINCVSNEKRGRSEYFPSLGYMKRLRDAINYSVIALQKSAAWSIDTTIEGDDSDIAAYIESQSRSTIAPAGSEFVHTPAVKREYLSNSAGGKAAGQSETFNWCLTMTCSATGIPVGYLGTHLAGGSTRASALVATEPVAKKFERRQKVYETVIQKLWTRLMDTFGIEAECEVTFPELITQDRSKKIQDVSFAASGRYISHERASEMIAKELDVTDYDYQEERTAIENEDMALSAPAPMLNPLSAPAALPVSDEGASAMTSDEKRQVKDNERNKNAVG